MRIDVITLFPDMFQILTHQGVTGRAFARGLYQLTTWNPRDYTDDVHHTVDDRPFGGGPGMVMMSEPLDKTLCDIRASHKRLGLPRGRVILLAPYGEVFDQNHAHAWSVGQVPSTASNLEGSHVRPVLNHQCANHEQLNDDLKSTPLIFVCGRYEGIDQRWVDRHVDAVYSLGDFVLSGAEMALLPMLDAVIRLLPNVLNNQQSHLQDSFSPDISGLLDHPHYTRPEVYEEDSVPEVLLSGHHARIARWRREASLKRTFIYRPDLIEKAREQGGLSKEDEIFLQNLML